MHNGRYWATTSARRSRILRSSRMSSSAPLPPDASARLAMLAEMLERSSSKPETDNHAESNRREASRVESTPRKSK
jgi:hypothetical protein